MFGISVANYPRSVNMFLENYLFVYFLAVNKNKTKLYVVVNIIFGVTVPDYPRTTTFLRKLICLLFSCRQKQNNIICC